MPTITTKDGTQIYHKDWGPGNQLSRGQSNVCWVYVPDFTACAEYHKTAEFRRSG